MKGCQLSVLRALDKSGITMSRSELLRAAPPGTEDEAAWSAFAALKQAGLIQSRGRRWALTDEGRERARAAPPASPTGPERDMAREAQPSKAAPAPAARPGPACGQQQDNGGSATNDAPFDPGEALTECPALAVVSLDAYVEHLGDPALAGLLAMERELSDRVLRCHRASATPPTPPGAGEEAGA